MTPAPGALADSANRNRLGQGLRQQSGLTLAVLAANVGLAFGVNVLLARLLGVDGYGQYAYLMAWLAVLLQVGVLGADRLLVRDLAGLRARQAWAKLRGLWRWANLSVAAASLAVAAAGWLGLAGAASSLGGRFGAGQAATLWVGLAALPFMALTLLRQAALQAEGHSLASQLAERIARPLLVAGLGLLAFAWQPAALDAPRAAAVFVAASALALLLSEALKQRLVRPVPVVPPEAEAKPWLASSTRLMFSTLLAILGEQASLLLVGVFVGAAGVGAYTAAFNGSRLVALGLLAVNVSLGPLVARAYALGAREDLAALARRSRRAVMAVTALLFAGMLLLGDVYLGVYGEAFRAARPVLVILCLGQLVNGACGPVALLLAMTNHERDVVAAMLLNLGLSVLGGLWLVPWLGSVGAAITTAAALAAWNVFLVMRVRRRLGINLLTSW